MSPHAEGSTGTMDQNGTRTSPTSAAVDFNGGFHDRMPCDADEELLSEVELIKGEVGEGSADLEQGEAEKASLEEKETPSNALISTWLFVWMVNNIAVTLLNKAVFAKFDFKYPFFLSAVHMVTNYIGSELCMVIADMRRAERGLRNYRYRKLNRTTSSVLDGIERSHLNRKGKMHIVIFSVIFSLNVAIGNVSLRFVSVNFNQVMRSLVPAVAIILGAMIGKKTSMRRKLAVTPVVIGVAMACYGDLSYTPIGFFVTCFSVFLAALKVVAAGEMLTGELKLHPVDLLTKMTPYAAMQCFVLSLATGEVASIASRWKDELSPTANFGPLFAVFVTGIFAFTMNISSLVTNKLTSPLTLSIAANAKQALIIILGTIVFETEITLLNGIGIVIVLFGSGVYSYVSLVEKAAAQKAQADTEQMDNSSDEASEEGVALVEMQKVRVG